MTNKKSTQTPDQAMRHLQAQLIDAAFENLTLDEGCKVASALALISIEDHLGWIKNSLDHIGSLETSVDNVELAIRALSRVVEKIA